jgi:hypothetical protein
MLLPFLDFCAHKRLYGPAQIHTVRPPVYVVLAASISVLVFCLGMHALALRNGLFLKLENALACSLSKCLNNQQWCALLTLIDLMREGQGSSHLTVEIR